MKTQWIATAVLVLSSCSVPGVGTITIKNKASFPVAAEFKMTKADGNKRGRVVTPADDDKNHDFTYKHDPLQETTDSGKQQLDFYFDGNFFHYILKQPAREIAEIRYRGEDDDIDVQIEVDPATLEDLSSGDLTKAFNKLDKKLLVFENTAETSALYIGTDKEVKSLTIGISSDPEDPDAEWTYVKMSQTPEVYLNSKKGHDIVQKTYVCDVDGCQAD